MKLRHLIAPVAIAALALAPLAATSSATAGGVPTNHKQTFTDTDETVSANAVNIKTVQVFRTASDYRAVVTLKDLTTLKATRYNVSFLSQYGQGTRGNMLDYRVSPSGSAGAVGYGLGDFPNLTKSTCAGNSVTPDYTKNSLTFVIAKKCWYSKTSPAYAIAGTKHYTSSAAYAEGSPLDTFNTESATSDNAGGCWNWGVSSSGCGAGKHALSRLRR